MPKRKGINSTEELRDDLQCPVCFVIPKSGPIFQCDFGHIHCSTCHLRIQECPICRWPIGNTRSLTTEKIIAKLPTKCAFADQGCVEDEKLPEDMILHEKECQFRLIKCLGIRKCDEMVSMADYLDHFKLKHPIDGKIGDTNGMTATVPLQIPKDMGLREGMFFGLRFIRSKKHNFAFSLLIDGPGFFSIYVYILGSQTDIEDEEYECRIVVEGTSCSGFRLCHKGHINVIDEKMPIPSITLHRKRIAKLVSDEDDNLVSFVYGVTISSTVDINIEDLECHEHDQDCTDFVVACHQGNEAKVAHMLKNNLKVRKKINKMANCGMNGFMIACRKGLLEIVSLFLKHAWELELDVNAKDKKKGLSGLTMAVIEGNLEIVKLLTKNKSIEIDLNTMDGAYFETPLMYACTYGFKDIVAYFLKLAESKKSHEFNLNAADKYGNTAFHHACISENEDIVELIIESAGKLKIELEAKNNEEKTGFDLWPDKLGNDNFSKTSKKFRV